MNGKIKSKIKNLVGNFYYSLFKKHQPTGNRALIYHAFGCKLEHDTYGISIDLNDFRKHINYLSQNYDFTHIGHESPKLTISITIDDGYKDSIDGIEILAEKNIPFTIYITSSLINKNNYMNSNDIYNISLINNCVIGAHGHNHLRLAEHDPQIQKTELKKSKHIIENIIGKSINTFSYPHGSFNTNTIEIAKQLGYQSAASSIKGFNNKSTNKFMLKRSEIIASDNISELSKKINGFYDFY